MALLPASGPVSKANRYPTYEEKAAQYLELGKKNARSGDLGLALERFALIMRRYADSPSAAEAQYEIGKLYEKNREFVNAFEAYQGVIDGYRESQYFLEALAGQYRVAVRVHREYRRQREEQAPNLPKRYVASEMLYRLVKSARHSEYAAPAQYQLGISLEKEKLPEEAAKEHENFLDLFPEHHLADDAAFQVAFISWKSIRDGSNDQGAVRRTRLDLEYFLGMFPDSPKAPEARWILSQLHEITVRGLVKTARTYEQLGNTKAARVYYRELLQNYPQTVRDEKLARQVEKLKKDLSPPED